MEARLRGFLDLQRRDSGGTAGRIPRLEVAGRPKWRFMDAVEEDMAVVGVREENAAEDRVKWRQMIGCGRP